MSQQRATVLIVEDEFIIAMGAAELLKDAGYDTVEASNADDAVRVLESGRDIEAIFTDIRMPGTMDGLALAWCATDGPRSRSSSHPAITQFALAICRRAACYP
jgi:CheY-like chemotaxis protein